MTESMSLIAIMLSLLGGGTIGVIVVKWLNRKVDAATEERIKAEARQIAANAASTEVASIQNIIGEYRKMYLESTNHNAQLRADLNQMNRRVDKLEERERHMLTRAGVHEAWAQAAWVYITTRVDADYPAPPPLAQFQLELLEEGDHSHGTSKHSPSS